jgi:hypothetical protein
MTDLTDPDFSDELRAFIRDNIPDVDAAELLLLIARRPDSPCDAKALAEGLKPTVMSEAVIRRHLAAFRERGLVAIAADGSCRYAPASPELAELVRALNRVYNERPVTMVRTIYALKDEKIRSCADAFRLKKEESWKSSTRDFF